MCLGFLHIMPFPAEENTCTCTSTNCKERAPTLYYSSPGERTRNHWEYSHSRAYSYVPGPLWVGGNSLAVVLMIAYARPRTRGWERLHSQVLNFHMTCTVCPRVKLCCIILWFRRCCEWWRLFNIQLYVAASCGTLSLLEVWNLTTLVDHSGGTTFQFSTWPLPDFQRVCKGLPEGQFYSHDGVLSLITCDYQHLSWWNSVNIRWGNTHRLVYTMEILKLLFSRTWDAGGSSWKKNLLHSQASSSAKHSPYTTKGRA